MKLTYLLQEVYNLPLGYRYTLYTYGPYASEVLADLERAEFRGEVKITYLEDQYGFRIELGSKSPHLLEDYEDKLSAYTGSIEDLVAKFGEFRVKELELMTTIIYVWKMVGPSDEDGQDRVVDVVQELKPHFQEADVRKAVTELMETNTISFPHRRGTH